MTKNDVIAALHEIAGKCGHCGNRSCSGRDAHSKLPDKLSTDDVFRALTIANRAVKKRRECRQINETISKAERGGDSGDSAEPMSRVRESARDTDATGDGDGLSPAAVPGAVGAQAGDRPQSSAVGSASPPNVSKGEPGAGVPTSASQDNKRSFAPVPGELCDFDDLPDCMVGGVHQPHCRHAGKPVTSGGNP